MVYAYKWFVASVAMLVFSVSAFAQSAKQVIVVNPEHAPVPVTVVDGDANGAIPFNGLFNIEFSGGSEAPSTSSVQVPPGRIHAVTLSSASDEPGEICRLFLSITIRDLADGNVVVSKAFASTMSIGDASAVALNFATPIEVMFDEATTFAEIRAKSQGSASFCWISSSTVYEQLN